MKKYCIFLLVFFIFCSIFYYIAGINEKNYLNTGTPIDSEAKSFMPVLEKLPKYQHITYKHKHKAFFIFQSDSVILVVKYDGKTYKKEKNKLTNKYIFLESKAADEMKHVIPESQFSINSYQFKVVDQIVGENKKMFYPKSFGMIGTSEEKNSIAYLYFYDFDLDSIGAEDDQYPMADFVKMYFDYAF